MAGRGSGYYDGYGYGYGFNEVTEYSPHSQPRRGSSNSPHANVSPSEQPIRESASSSRPVNGLSSRVSSVSDLNGPPAPFPDSYFGDYSPNQRQQSQHENSYAVSPPSLSVSQFEPYQSNMPGTSNGYTVSPLSRPVSQFESFQSAYQPAPLRTASDNSTSPTSQPTSQFKPRHPQAPRRYSSGSYSAGTPYLEEVDITLIPIAEEPKSPMEDYSTFGPPPISQSPISRPAYRTASTRSTGSWKFSSLLHGYQPLSTAAPPPTPASPSAERKMSQKSKSFLLKKNVSVHTTQNGDGGGMELIEYDHQPRDRTESVVDLSSMMYSEPRFDDKTTKEYHVLELSGQLTGGIGSNPVAAKRLTTSQLMASSPVDLSRKLTRMGTRMNRNKTVRNLAQREADRLGKPIIAVIDEEAVGIDIGGGYEPSFQTDDHQRIPTMKTEEEIIYPTANWKPFTMRWPYLTFLILISAALGACQEYLYQQSLKEGGILQFQDPAKMFIGDFFTSKYLGAIVTVAYGVLWQLTDVEVKRLEPYYQLGKDEGALAAHSISIDYTTLFDFLRPFTAFWYKHWAVAVSSIASVLAVIVIPVLQSASQDLDPKRGGPDVVRTIGFENAWSRALTFTLFGVSLLGLTLLVILQMRSSGLATDVKGIAGVVAMANRSHILNDFTDMDTFALRDIHDSLKEKRYTLKNSVLAPKLGRTKGKWEKEKKAYDEFKLDNKPHPLMLRRKSGWWLQVMLTLFLLLIPVLLFTPLSIVSEKLPWLTTAIAVGLKFVMQTVEMDLRMMEPFYVLVKRGAPARTLVLDYTSMAFGEMPMQALLNGHLLLASLGIGSILLEVLTVCVSSLGTVSGGAFVAEYVPNTLGRGQETPLSFWLSLGIFTVIMFYLMVTTAMVMMYRNGPFLPRQPSTIASVLAFVHKSDMLYDFAEEAKKEKDGMPKVEESNNKMVARLELAQKRYGYGWFIGRDGKRHCGVDQEPLLADYIYGEKYDHRKGTIDPNDRWQEI